MKKNERPLGWNEDKAAGQKKMADDQRLNPIKQRYEQAKSNYDKWRPVWQECYEYAMPGRPGFYSQDSAGKKFTDKMYDMTASVSVQEFASRLQANMTPTFSRFIALKPGKDVPPDRAAMTEKGLDEITEEISDTLMRSNFDSQVHEAYLDLAVGTGNLLFDEDPMDVFRFTAVPLSSVMLDAGPFDSLDGRFRTTQKNAEEIELTWPQGSIPDSFKSMGQKERRERKFDVVEATYRDWNERGAETWRYCVFMTSPLHCIEQRTFSGLGSNPWVNFRWSVAAGEVYGRGPLLNALPDIKVANKVVELTLRSAHLALAGMWQVEDDGVINPATIRLVPGTVIPIAQGSKGLQSIAPNMDFNVSELILSDLRFNIKRALFDEGLGTPDKTPPTAYEVSERKADLYRRIGSSFGRLQRELIQQVVRRAIFILKKRGRIRLPDEINQTANIVSVSPLSNAQAQEDIMRFNQFVQSAAQTFGPQMLPMLLKPPQAVEWLAKQFDIRLDLINTAQELTQIMQQAAMAAQQAQMQQAQMGAMNGSGSEAGPPAIG